jgi:hypothetical protein
MSAGSAFTTPGEPREEAAIREEAWIGDAVLALYARSWILENTPETADRTALFIRMTSNRFLTAFGEPTRVEARIGRVYAEGGLPAAFALLDETILPLFKKQNAFEGRR